MRMYIYVLYYVDAYVYMCIKYWYMYRNCSLIFSGHPRLSVLLLQICMVLRALKYFPHLEVLNTQEHPILPISTMCGLRHKYFKIDGLDSPLHHSYSPLHSNFSNRPTASFLLHSQSSHQCTLCIPPSPTVEVFVPRLHQGQHTIPRLHGIYLWLRDLQ